MKAIIAWWNLRQSAQTVESLQNHLQHDGVSAWTKTKGLILKFWISDVNNQLWGAVMLWESNEYINQSLPPNRATELIGYPPTIRLTFEIEALVEGSHKLSADQIARHIINTPSKRSRTLNEVKK